VVGCKGSKAGDIGLSRGNIVVLSKGGICFGSGEARKEDGGDYKWSMDIKLTQHLDGKEYYSRSQICENGMFGLQESIFEFPT
jgi:hypothetical protein